ncbi:putative polypeptide N-acetylgalactosaminyltransferase 9 [Uranotaenia lowii]|uniref:putative polypeptide N-acetylgalactosaminyltransferase 9 n=1 Tax=Uranotaenia lowii TaxID=190385 RepID=UPI00247A230D|nr:putative polypeptide N-acetylgalactosaminyltransferase 9 [Uranotaenia lowii]
MAMVRNASRYIVIFLGLLVAFCVVGYMSNSKNMINNQTAMLQKFLAQKSAEENEKYLTPPPGDLGSAIIFNSSTEESIGKIVQEGWKSQGLNQYASDLVSVHRRLPDIRAEWCKEPDRYSTDLPETSVVIVFYNEAWSVLVRTVHSVLDRSPPELIREIVLVDDFSYLRTYEFIKINLSGFIQHNYKFKNSMNNSERKLSVFRQQEFIMSKSVKVNYGSNVL